MYKYKVCVYAICKNEEQFVDKWYESVKEADKIYVLDTGSTDNTMKLLESKDKVVVKQQVITPWRFDVARNLSLDMVPQDTDICVCIDFDEILSKGWRKELEKNWNSNINRVRYNYIWSFDEYNNPAVYFYLDNIHQRKDYYWTHPVHEVLTYKNANEKYLIIDSITLSHYPDVTKSRSSYLPLLELSVKEEPLDDRNMHYLGREYMYHGQYEKAINTLKKHLKLEKASWKDERSASMRFIARSYYYKEKVDTARMWYRKAIKETPYLREPYTELGILEYLEGNYEKSIKYLKEALQIKKNFKTYINDPICYNGTIEDILSVCLYNLDSREEALGYAIKASLMQPNNERIKNNIEIIKNNLLYIDS